jgi:hypothetical protein
MAGVELKSFTASNDEEDGPVDETKQRRRFLIEARQRVAQMQMSNTSSSRIKMFGIKCNFGTDDFFFLGLFALALRAAWYVNF